MTEERTKQSRTGGATLWAAGSVLLNIFLIGVILGAWTRGISMSPPPPLSDFLQERIYQALPADDAHAVDAVFEAQGKAFAKHEDAVHGAFGGLMKNLREEKVDPATVDQAFTAVNQADQILAVTTKERILSLLNELPYGSRLKLLDFAEDKLAHGPQGRMGPPPPPPPMWGHQRPSRQ